MAYHLNNIIPLVFQSRIVRILIHCRSHHPHSFQLLGSNLLVKKLKAKKDTSRFIKWFTVYLYIYIKFKWIYKFIFNLYSIGSAKHRTFEFFKAKSNRHRLKMQKTISLITANITLRSVASLICPSPINRIQNDTIVIWNYVG